MQASRQVFRSMITTMLGSLCLLSATAYAGDSEPQAVVKNLA